MVCILRKKNNQRTRVFSHGTATRLFPYITVFVQVVSGNWDVGTALYAERFNGEARGGGPGMAFAGFDDRYASFHNGTTRAAIFYLIGVSSDNLDELYPPSGPDNPYGVETIMLPVEFSIITGSESGVTLKILYDAGFDIGAGPIIDFVDVSGFRDTVVCAYPALPSVNPLFPVWERTKDALMFANNYSFPLEFLGLGTITVKNLYGTALDIVPRAVVYDPITGDQYIGLSNDVRQLDHIFVGLDAQGIITGIQFDQEPMLSVNADSLEFFLRTRKFNEGSTVNVRFVSTADTSTGTFYETGPLPTFRSMKTSFGRL